MSRDYTADEQKISSLKKQIMEGVVKPQESLDDLVGLMAVMQGVDIVVLLSEKLLAALVELEAISALPEYIERLTADYVKTSEAESTVKKELTELILTVIEDLKKPQARAAFTELAALESELRQALKEKIEQAKANPVAGEEHIPDTAEILTVFRPLVAMSMNAPLRGMKFDISFTLCPLKKTFESLKNLLTTYQAFEKAIAESDIALRNRIFYKNRLFRYYDLEKLRISGVDQVWKVVEKIGIDDKSRDEENAKQLVAHIINFQHAIMLKLKPLITRIGDELSEQLKFTEPAQIREELERLRDDLKPYILEAEREAIFSDESDVAFYSRVSKSIVMLNQLTFLRDPEQVTLGEKTKSQEKYKELIDDKTILRAYREELQSVIPKLTQNQDIVKGLDLIHRLVFVVQFIAREMRDYLKEQQSVSQMGLFSTGNLDALGDVSDILAIEFK